MLSTQNLIEQAKQTFINQGLLLNNSSAGILKTIAASGIDSSKAIADIREFNKLIEDYIITPSAMTADSATGQLKINTGTETKSYEPRLSFLSAVANRVNRSCGISRASGIFFETLRSKSPEAQKVWADMMNLFFSLFQPTNAKKAKNIKVRCLKAHPTGKWGITEPVVRSIVGEDYQEENSHLWLIESLQKLAPTGRIMSFHFCGDKLSGLWIIPELLIQDGADELGVGLYFKQGEIANSACSVEPAVFLGSFGGWYGCGKTTGTKFVLRHNSVFDPIESFKSLTAEIDSQIPLLTTAANLLITTKYVDVDKVYARQYITYFSKEYSLSPEIAQHWLSEFNNTATSTAYDLIGSLVTVVCGLGEDAREACMDIPQHLTKENWTAVNKAVKQISDSVCERFLTGQ